MNHSDFKDKFIKDKGVSRLITNLVYPTIRNFNFNPDIYNIPGEEPLFHKIIIKGSKAFDLMLDNPTENTFDVDADIFLNKELIKDITAGTPTFIQSSPKIKEKIEGCERQLNHLANVMTKEFNKKVNFSAMDDNNYTNMMYIIQLDAIVNKYKSPMCKNAFLIPSTVDKDRCYNCKVVNEIKLISIPISEEVKSMKKLWLLKFAFQFDFKETFIKRDWLPKGLKIPFFDITVANPYLQIENYNGTLDMEISPQLFIIRPNLILDNLVDMASQPEFYKKKEAKNRYNKLIHQSFGKYNCAILNKISSKKNSNNSIIRRRQLIKNNPIVLARSNEELFKQKFVENMEKELDNFILNKLEGNNKKKILDSLPPQQKQEYKKQFIQKKLKNISAIGNNHITTNAAMVKTQFSNILEPYKNFVNVFYNAHSNYEEEYRNAKEKCSKFYDLQKEFTISNVDLSANNTNKLSDGILTKYKKDTTTDNFYPRMFYNIYSQSIQLQSLFFGRNTDVYRIPIIKFTSFGYWKFFTNIESQERIRNSVWPTPVCLDELEEDSKYFVNINIPDTVDKKSKIISRNFLNQRGFLIVIYPLSYLKKPVKHNVRQVELEVNIGNKKEKRAYKFFNSNVKFIKKIPSYQKVIIDGTAYLDRIDICVFHELPQN